LSANPNLRPKPHDIDAERAVLAAMMLRPEAIDEALTHLHPEDWYLVKHQAMFEAIVQIDQANGEVNHLSVLQAMRTRNAADTETSAYLGELSYEAIVGDVEAQAQRLAALGKARALLKGLEVMVEAGYHTKDPEQWLEAVERTVTELTDREAKTEQLLLQDQLSEVFATLTEREKPEGNKGYWPTSLSTLNHLIYGWIHSLLYIVAGTPGRGKTSFMLQQGWELAGTRVGDEVLAVVFFSMEMPHGEIVERMLSQASLVPNTAMKRGQLQGHWSALTVAAAELGKKPIFIDDTPALSVMEVRARTRRAMSKLRKRHPSLNLRLAMVVCDHLQLMSGKGETRDQQLGGVTKGLMKFAKDTMCVVAALSQLNRTQQKEKNRDPILADLRDSGNIEADANTVIFLHEENAIVAKNRGGKTGKARLHFKGECTLFSVPEHDPEFDPSDGYDAMGGN
jgi:replicative DNA helicase